MPEEQGDGLRSQKESIFSAPEPREYCYLTLACWGVGDINTIVLWQSQDNSICEWRNTWEYY